uniref:F-box only protein 21 isoform X9 n=1 Tax=Halichoerus grypus TaxID=9711 RepID=UPI001659AD52|nr:F-box only protein 21 isoform X9 [Halichoerus grypus]
MAAAAVDSAMEVVPALAEEAAPEAAGLSCLVNLPGEVLEYILCSGSLTAADIGRVSSTCRRLRELCQSSGKVWKEQFRVRWPSLMKHYSPTDYVNWLEEYKVRQKAGLEARKIVASFSKRFFSEHVPCNGFSDIENLEGPEIFFEDELVCILNMEGRKALTWKYYAKKILYYLRQQKILNNLKAFLQQPDDYESYLEGAVYIDQYCNPLSDISLKDIQAQIDSIVELVCKTLRGINTRHPSLAFKAGESSMIMEIELQSQVLDAMNYVLYDQLKFKGNRMDYYNALNLYMHQVLIRRTGIPISMSLLYLTIARQLGVPLEPVNFPSHFLLRWCQGAEGYGYNCVIYGWDPTCMMGHEWIRNMNVHSLPHGHHQPFYNVLVEDGSCRYAAQVSPQMTPAPSPECLPLVFPSTNGHSWRLFLQGHRYSLPALCHLSHWHPPDSPAGPRGDLEPSSQPHLCSHRRHTPAQQTLLFRETVLLMGPHTSGCPLWTGSLPPPHPPPRHSPTELRSGHLSLL